MSHMPLDLTALLEIDVTSLDNVSAFDLAATLIDLGNDSSNLVMLDHAISVLNDLEQRSIPDAQAARLHYFRANAWAGKGHSKPPGWMWISDEIDNELLSLRRAIAHPGFSQLGIVQRAQVHTDVTP